MDVSDFPSAFRRSFPDLVGQPVLVALSGGADSVALLHLLRRAHPDLGCPVAAVHVNHHARPEADDDEGFCRELCRELGVALEVHHLLEPCPRGRSREAWWREQRYERLEAARRSLGCAATATAHTRDDQAETVLLKLLRGSGPRGVAGIRRRCGTLVRPLLELGRAQLRGWLREIGGSWREDPGNADPAQPRAWLRLVGLPALEARFAGSTRHLSAFARALADDDEALSSLAAALPRLEIGQPVARQALASVQPAVQRRWLLALAAELPLAEPPDRTQVEAFEALLAAGVPAAVDLGRRWVLRRRGERLVLCPPPLAPFPPLPASLPSRIDLAGYPCLALGRAVATAERVVHTAWLAARLASAEVRWRPLAPGETVAWPHARGRIGRLLGEAGVPAEWRRAWPVLEADGRMIWIPGVGTAPGWAGEPGQGIVATVEEPWKRHVR
ncbi:MAG TPA: tRNA lysidine(34) synthetase TilS [Thermoanaerobaculaceae bacterium]|nr:tRNA lysidine(34) synthetase TilS [Thermoanaerobaculaceae bacterium]HRS16236.1 tRNA lysidine(34) synthetase TilS [Thermoanaerobaculaceae bacterium]